MRESRTSSSSYSSSSPIRSGGGGGSFFWDSNARGMYGFKRASLKTGCTFQDDGSLSLYEDSPFFETISNGPLHLLSSFCVGHVDFRFSEVTPHQVSWIVQLRLRLLSVVLSLHDVGR